MTTDQERTVRFEQVWKTLGLDDETQQLEQDATIMPRRQLRDSVADELELPTLRFGDDPDQTSELLVTGSLGQGGMGIVHIATQRSLGREVAVKSLRPDKAQRAARHRLLQEAWMTGLLEHPNIVPIHQLGRDQEGEPALVMKLIEGVSWKAILHGGAEPPVHQHEHDGPLDLHLEILQDVCHALEFAHSRGIVHRDLKPENVMIGAFGEVYLLDWGVAVSLEDDGSGRLPLAAEVDHIAGTPSYLAPEMTEVGLAPITPATDVYLLGAVLHEVLNGVPPHQGDSLYSVLFAAHACEPPEFGDDVPGELAAICRRAMSRDPTDRYPAVQDFREAIAEYLRHRASYMACDEALGILTELERLLDGAAPVDHERAYELLGQCRFGFQQALRIHEGNEAARDGLQAVLERMVDYEIDRGAHGAAQALIDQMPRPDQVAQERRSALEQLLTEKRAEIEQLRQLRRDLDLNVGARSRIYYVIALGVFWGFLSMVTGVIIRLGLSTPTALDMLTPNVLFAGALGLAIVVWRRTLLGNIANRRLALAFLLMFVGSSALGVASHWLAFTASEIVAMDMVVMFLVTAMIAVAIDHRLAWLAGIYLVAIFVCAAFNPYAFEIAGVADLGAMSLLALLWRPREEPEGG